MPYAGKRIDLEDREALCKGLCVVIASLRPDKHDEAINKLTQPILSFLNEATKEVDTNVAEKVSILQRLANEIRLLASVVTHFVRTDAQSRFNSVSAMLQKSWQILVSVANITEEVCFIRTSSEASFALTWHHLLYIIILSRSSQMQS